MSRLKTIGPTVILALSLALPGCSQTQDEAPDFTGTWDLSFNSQMGPQIWTLTLELEGDSLSGRAESPMGAMLVAGSVDGAAVEFGIDIAGMGPGMTMTFTGEVSGDDASGTVAGMGADVEGWTAKRSTSQ